MIGINMLICAATVVASGSVSDAARSKACIRAISNCDVCICTDE
jgi:hypothetical protein